MLKHDKKENVMTNDNNKPSADKDPATFSTAKNNKLADHINSNDMTKMGWLHTMKLNGAVGKVTSEKLAEIAKNMVEAQKQEITHHLMLNLDVNKKHAFNQYMEKVGYLNSDMIKRSNEMEKDLVRILRDVGESIENERNEWIKKIEGRKLSDEAHKKETDKMNKWIGILEQQAEVKIELLMKTHTESLQATLQFFKDTTLDNKGKSVLD